MTSSHTQPRRFSTLFILLLTAFVIIVSQKCAAALLPSEIGAWEVRYGMDPASMDSTISLPAEATGHALTGLLPGATYYCQVTAISAAGIRSSPSATIIYQVPKQDPIPPVDPAPQPAMVKLHIYRISDLTHRELIATLYVPRKEKDFFQFGIELGR